MKKALIALAAVAVVIIVGVAYVWSNLDGIVKGAIQTYGSQATKTAVKVASVKIDLKQGKAQIAGLTVANPSGFSDPYIFKLGSIGTKIDLSTIRKNPVVIDEIDISAPSVVYEINKAGLSNVGVLKSNLAMGSSGGGSSSSSGGGVKMIIRKLVVDRTSAKVRIAALGGREQSVSLPKIVMTNIGQKSGGATASEVASQLSQKLLGNVQTSVAALGVDKYLGKSADAIKKQMQGAMSGAAGGASDATKSVGGALKGLLGN